MFNDRKQELERLSEELWEDSQEALTDEEATEDEDLLSEETLNQLLDIDVHNSDRSDIDLQELSEEVLRPEKRRWTGLILTVALTTAAILVILLWWVLRHYGVV